MGVTRAAVSTAVDCPVTIADEINRKEPMGRLSGTRVNDLELRDLSEDQAEAFFDHVERNRAIYADFIPFVSRTRDLPAMRRTVEQNLARQAQGLAEFYTLWSGERMAGYFLVREKDPDARWAEIGYMLGREWHRQGITARICTLLIDDLFQHQGMDRIVLACAGANTASIGVGAKLGFTLEGRLRNHCVMNGKRDDMVYMGLLKSEWTAPAVRGA